MQVGGRWNEAHQTLDRPFQVPSKYFRVNIYTTHLSVLLPPIILAFLVFKVKIRLLNSSPPSHLLNTSLTPPQLLLTHHLVTSGRADRDLLQRPPPPGPRPPEGGPHPQQGLHQGDHHFLVSLSSALTPAGGHLHPIRLQGAEPGALRGLRPPEHRAALQPGRFRWVL